MIALKGYSISIINKSYSLPVLCDGVCAGGVAIAVQQPGYCSCHISSRRGVELGTWWPHPSSTVGGVPGVVAGRPGQLRGERREQIVEGPGQDHVVVYVRKTHDHARCSTDSWTNNNQCVVVIVIVSY